MELELNNELTLKDIELLANDLSNKFKERPINLALVIEDIGLKAEYSKGMSMPTYLDQNNKTIYLNEDINIKENLYKIAYEIGKYLINNIEGLDESKVRLEKEEVFATNLMLPYVELRNKMMIGYTPEHIKNTFLVPLNIAEERYNYIASKID